MQRTHWQVVALGQRLRWTRMASCSAPAPALTTLRVENGTRPHADALRDLRAPRQVVAPGLRLGWVTAAPAVIQKLVFHLHGISLGACSYTQACMRSPLPYPASLPYAWAHSSFTSLIVQRTWPILGVTWFCCLRRRGS